MAVLPNHELFQEDLIALAGDLRTVFSKAQDLKNRYDDTGLAAIVFALATDATTVPGLKFDKGTMIGMITAAVQFVNFMEGDTVVEGSYRAMSNLVDALRDE